MSIINSLEKRALGAADDHWYQPGGYYYGGSGIATKAGQNISELSAMQLAVVWCCIKVLSEDTASLPLHLYRRDSDKSRSKAVDHSLYRLLHDSPNPEMTAISFRETYMSHLLAWGNAYAEKQYGTGLIGRSRVEALWPITPDRVTVKRNAQKKIEYHIKMTGTDLQDVILPKEKVLHTPGLSFNGLTGYSPIAAAREAIGLGKSLEEFGSLYFGNGTHPGVVISHPGKLSPEAHASLQGALAESHSGLGKSHRLMLLQEAMKIEKIGIPNDEAQFLESRKFQNIDIGSRIYRLFPQMYGEYDKASTYASAEQFSLDYVVKTLRPWLVRLEQSFNMSLLSDAEKGRYFFEHLIDGLMRGDAAARSAFYSSLFPIGGITTNMICELENWNPIGPEGDKRFVPLNMVPLDQAGQEPANQPPEPPPTQQNSLLYRSRLETAYLRLFTDAIGRVTRQESQRVNWLRKNEGDIDEFYRDFPDFIKKQLIPVCLSFSEAITGMESELNGLKYDDFKGEIDHLSRSFCDKYAEKYVTESRKLADLAALEWRERDLSESVKGEISAFANEIIGFLRGKMQ